jgi:hypothetical protein
MSLVVKGNASAAVDFQAEAIAVSSPRKFNARGAFMVTANASLPSALALMRYGPGSSGISVSAQSAGPNNIFRVSARVIEITPSEDPEGSPTSASPVYSCDSITITPNQRYDWGADVDLDEGFIKIWINNVLVKEHLKGAGKTWNWHSFPTQAAIPRIQGASVSGFDFEVFDFVGLIGGVLTDVEAAEFSFDNDLSELSSPPEWGIKPTGETGAHAEVIADLYGENDMAQKAGPTPPTAGYPAFSGGSGDDVLTNVVATSTARKITVSGVTSVSDGTIYIIVDKPDNYGGAPDYTDIKNGLLDDSDTSAAFRRSVSMLGETGFSEEFVVGEAAEAYRVWLYHDTNDEGANSNKVSVSVSTKRPVIKPAGASIWYGLDRNPLVSEEGMSWKVVGTSYTASGFSTDTNARGEIDLTDYVNGGATKDIGDTIDVIIERTNGEALAALAKTIVDGDA